MGEETASSPATTAGAITTTGGPTRASTAEAAGSPSLPEKSRLSTETISSHNALPSPPPPSTSTSAIPFSWEEHPGVPKATSSEPASPPEKQPAASPSPTTKLPLPPPIRPGRVSDGVLSRIKKRPGARAGDRHADPFTVALVTCSRGDDGEIKGGERCEKGAGVVPVASAGKLVGYSWRKGSWRWGVVGDRFGMASCMPATAATGAVMDSTVRVPRRSLPAPTAAGSSYGLPARRPA